MQQLDGSVSQDDEALPGDETAWYDETEWCPEEELETVHVYYYREQPKRPRRPVPDTVIALIALAFLLAGIVALCLIPTTPTYAVITLRVPAQITPLTLRASVQILPTGKHISPATRASGRLTIYNGGFLVQQVPAGFLMTTISGVEVQTDEAATIPAVDSTMNPPTLGIATITAHAVAGGTRGNIAALTVNQTYGNALYIKNLAPFTGGQDASTETYITSQDRTTALTAARAQLTAQQPAGLTTGPCAEETAQKEFTLTVVWSCQYVAYQMPKDGQIVFVRVSGESVILKIRVVEHPVVTHFAK